MVFVISGKGFFKESFFDKELLKHELIWVNELRNAKVFTKKKQARNFIEKYNLDAFIWNPNEEEPIKEKYQVIRRTHYTDRYRKPHEALEWYVEKARMMARSDSNFLNNTIDENELYDLDEAKKICHENNLKILEDIQNKIKNYLPYESANKANSY